MSFSRYQTAAPEAERRQLFSLIENLLRQPPEAGNAAWEDFMTNRIRLPLCYLDGVRKLIQQGKWKAKLDPVNFIRKHAQSASFASLNLRDFREDRTRIYVGQAIDEDQKSSRTLEESLRFDQPKRRPKAYAGNIADLKLPAVLEIDDDGSRSHGRDLHDEALAYFDYKYGKHWDDSPRWRKIAPDVLLPVDEEGRQNMNWARVAAKAGLDESERKVLKWIVAGFSRDSVIARQKTSEDKRSVQAAWRRTDRQWPRIIEAIKEPPSQPLTTAAPDTFSHVPISAPEALGRLKVRREAEKSYRYPKPDSIPGLPRYTDYARL